MTNKGKLCRKQSSRKTVLLYRWSRGAPWLGGRWMRTLFPLTPEFTLVLSVVFTSSPLVSSVVFASSPLVSSVDFTWIPLTFPRWHFGVTIFVTWGAPVPINVPAHLKLHSKRVEKIETHSKRVEKTQNYTPNEWRRSKNTLETSVILKL